MPTPRQDLEWLRDEHSLDELVARFPKDWERAEIRLRRATAGGRDTTHALIGELARPPRGSRDRTAPLPEQVSVLAQRRMIELALRVVSDRRESGVADGTIRFGRFSGTLLQHALFRRGLERKPASMLAFRIAWRLAGQRNRLMPLVRQEGIYCFYSAALVRRLAREIGPRDAVEIAAGDGTLTGFLKATGVDVTATDDYSWAHRVTFPGWVERADARTALRRLQPRVVICSWPPAGNPFERYVFQAPSVETYIVITSADRAEAGNWTTYLAQDSFTCRADPTLSALVLPPRRNQVLVFNRRVTRD